MSPNETKNRPAMPAKMPTTQLATTLVLWRQWLNGLEKGSLTFRTEVWT